MMNTIFHPSKTVIKVEEKKKFRKVYLPMKVTGRCCFCLLHSHDLKPKQNHQIATSRAKTKSRRSQTCVNFRANIICIKRNTDVNTSDLKILNKKRPNKVDFPDIIFNFSKLSFGLLQPNA